MRVKFIFTVFILSVALGARLAHAAAKEEHPVVDYCASLENEKIKYFHENKYAEFIDFLDNYKVADQQNNACIHYYRALARYAQLGYLEENQSWNEYFASGNDYREQIVDGLNKVIAQTNAADSLRAKSRLLSWQFHNGLQDAFSEQALIDLMLDLQAYVASGADTALVKDIADTLLANNQKLKARELYKLYVDKLVKNNLTDAQLKTIAAGFYKEKNLELAQTVYDIYIKKISAYLKEGELTAELFEIASLFVYKPTGLNDPVYAEKIYALIEASGQKDAFNQESIYLRAFNLEKMNADKEAQNFYRQLTPDNRHFQEATYKIAMINAYALANLSEAQKYFQILAAQTAASPHVISSLYQLGLLSQWQGDFVKASSYYDTLIKSAQDKYTAIAAQANERIKEIQENKPIAYNLKTFLDLSLKNETALLEMNQAQLTSAGYILEKNQNNLVSALVSMPQSGCNQVELQYLWSGDLGSATPEAGQSSFQGAYADSGTKEINLVVVSPAGTIDRLFMMVDVY